MNLKENVFFLFPILILCLISVSIPRAGIASYYGASIYIRADGNVDPSTAPIQQEGNVYFLTDNVTAQGPYGIVIERDNVTLNGAGFTLQGNGGESGVSAFGRTGIAITDLKIRHFWFDVELASCSNGIINGSQIMEPYIGVYLRSSNNIEVTSNALAYGSYGIVLESSSGTICFNNMWNFNVGIVLDASNYNIVRENSITGNIVSGIDLDSSHGNRIIGNNITENWPTGIDFTSSDNNTVSNNRITGSDAGITVVLSSGNMFFCNFLDSNYQVLSCHSSSIWDDGLKGNYWSDYEARYPNATQTNGIWSIPYEIADINQSVSFDHYPLADQTIVPEFNSPLIPLFLFTLATVAVILETRRRKHPQQI